MRLPPHHKLIQSTPLECVVASIGVAFFLTMQDAYLKLAENILATKQTDSPTIFNNPQFGEIRIIVDNMGNPMFCLADVCKALDISNVGNVKQRLSEKGICNMDTLTPGGIQSMTYVNEPNLYKCIFQSRKERAEEFQDWVCGDILPSIRKTGQYSVNQLSRKDLAMMVIQAEEEKERLMLENRAQADKIAEDAPKVEFHDNIVASDDTCLVRELAKILTQRGFKIGQNRLYEILRNEGYLVKNGSDYNQPTQQYVENGIFEVDRKPWTNPKTGEKHIGKTSKVTAKGIKYFLKKFLGKAAAL